MGQIKEGNLFIPSEIFGNSFDNVLLNIQNGAITKTEKKVLLALSKLTTSEGLCRAPAVEIAKQTDIHHQTINGATVSLSKKGFLISKKLIGTPNTYFFVWQKIYSEAKKGPVYDKDYDLFVIKNIHRTNKPKFTIKFNNGEAAALLTEIKTHYHPNRANLQPMTAKREIASIFNQATSNLKNLEETTRAVNKKKTQIIEFIDKIKTTNDWKRDNGKFLLGFGNFLVSRGWETSLPIKAGTVEDELSKLIENEL